MVNKTTYVDRILAKFGGPAATAKALGHRNRTTVQGWKERGTIPALQHKNVIEAARRNRIRISPRDFFDWPEDDEPKGAGPRERASAP